MINRGFQNLVFEKKGLMAHLKQGFSSFICPFFCGQKMKKKKDFVNLLAETNFSVCSGSEIPILCTIQSVTNYDFDFIQ